MKIRIRQIEDISVLDIEGRIDINSSEIIEAIGALIKHKRKNILLNLKDVDLMDYSGISILAIAYKNVVNHNGKLKLCNVGLHITELLKLVRLDSVFEVCPGEKEALETFHHDSPLDSASLRRRFKRLEMPIEAEFSKITDRRGKKDLWHGGKILNISGEGLYLYAKKNFPIGTRVVLRLKLASKTRLLLEGRVAWIADKTIQPQSYPGMGIRFNDLKKREQDKILEFINRHITGRSQAV